MLTLIISIAFTLCIVVGSLLGHFFGVYGFPLGILFGWAVGNVAAKIATYMGLL